MPFVLAFAVADWFAVATGNKRAEYFFKPAFLSALIVLATLQDAPDPVVAALVFSLVGDVFLMLPRDSLFIYGLASFLFAHVAYFIAFRPLPGEWWIPAILLLPVAIVLVSKMKRGAGSLFPAVVAYMAAILAMVVAAVSGYWEPEAADSWPFAAAGALLFMSSDALIGWNRFVKPLAWGPVAIIVTYHLAQMLLVASFIG